MSGYTGNTNASKRRALAQEALRMKIVGDKLLTDLDSIDLQLETAEPSEVARLKARADIKFGLLKKILSDLKAVEISGDEDAPLSHVHRVERTIIHANPGNTDSGGL